MPNYYEELANATFGLSNKKIAEINEIAERILFSEENIKLLKDSIELLGSIEYVENK